MPHIIRLREPWEFFLRDNHGVLQRSFHQPTGLDAFSRVELVVENVALTAISLNEQPLAASASQRYDITALLAQRNLLKIEIIGAAAPPDMRVRLEISDRSPN